MMTYNKLDFVNNVGLLEQLDMDIKHYKLLCIQAPIGWGKKTIIQMWMNRYKRQVQWIHRLKDIELQEFSAETYEEQIFVFEGFSWSDETYIKMIRKWLKISKKRNHFIFLCQTRIPKFLCFNEYIKNCKYYTEKELSLPFEKVMNYFEKQEVVLSFEELTLYKQEFIGYPLEIHMIMESLTKEKAKLNTALLNVVRQEISESYYEILKKDLSLEAENFLFSVLELESFNIKMIQFILQNNHINQLIEEVLDIQCCIRKIDDEQFRVEPTAPYFFTPIRNRKMSEKEVILLNNRIANYYEIQEEIYLAMKFYMKANNHSKLKEVLSNHSKKIAMTYEVYELEQYYDFLSIEELEQDPYLISGIASLKSMMYQRKESEYWITKLEDMLYTEDKNTVRYNQIEGELFYLYLVTAHKGSKKLLKVFLNSVLFAKNKEFHMHEISITGERPSLVSGGKDFSEWTINAEVLYKMLKGIFHIVFKQQAYGLAEVGLGETFYERDDLDVSSAILNKGINESRSKGTIDILFAGTAIMTKILMVKKLYSSAMNLIQGIKQDLDLQPKKNFSYNYEAFVTRLYMLKGICDEEQHWFHHLAPDESVQFRTLDRYIYLTKVRSYILRTMYTQALMLLNQLLKFTLEYDRKHDYLESLILKSIVLYRISDQSWQSSLLEALQKAARYKFIRIFADEGSALYPLLREFAKNSIYREKVNLEYFRKTYAATRKMMKLYPDYLKSNMTIQFSESELRIAHLMTEGYKNSEMAKMLDISENTIKYHLKNIYMKLNVNSKAKAILSFQTYDKN